MLRIFKKTKIVVELHFADEASRVFLRDTYLSGQPQRV